MIRRAACLLLLLCAPALATEQFDPTQAAETERGRWAKTELLKDPHPKLIQEKFIPLVEHTLPEITKAFGDASPPSSQGLLHYAEGWDEAKADLVPVVLVHGAGLTSSHCYGSHPIEQPYDGLAKTLARSGRAVFALTYAHMHGDNFLQAEMLANAIARVKHVTGKEQVDLVAHSKGGMSARIYLSDAGPSWSTRFRKDVRRYVMLGTPNAGIDVAFAYPNLNYWVLEHKVGAPLTFTAGYHYGQWKDWSERTLYANGPFPGQAQMVARFDERYGMTRAKGQLDVQTTYEGGKGQFTVSKGIDQAIADGGNLIAALQKKGVHPSVELAVLAGTSPWVMHMIGERRGPSDGLLLVASATDTSGLTRRGAKVLRSDLLHLNHLQLVYEPRANAWVLEVLSK